MSFHTSLSGLNAASTKLATTSNNIANAATDTFKRSDVNFADIYARNSRIAPNTHVGNGVLTANVSQQFTQGSMTSTGRTLDLAIAGNGFFKTRSADDGTDFFTRGGAFNIDKDNFVVNNSGDRLIAQINSTTQPLKIPQQTVGEFQATTRINQQLALPSNTRPITATFDRTKSETYHAKTNFTFYDEAGILKSGEIYYIKGSETHPNSNLTPWESKVFVGGVPVSLSSTQTPVKIEEQPIKKNTPMGFSWEAYPNDINFKIELRQSNFEIEGRKLEIKDGEVFERADGKIIKIGQISKTNNQVSIEFIPENEEQTIGLSNSDIYKFLQSDEFDNLVIYERQIPVDGKLWVDKSGRFLNEFANSNLKLSTGQEIVLNRQNSRITTGNFNTLLQNQNGRPEGDLASLEIGEDGTVVGVYSNGSNNVLGQLLISSFVNPNGLRQVGDTRYLATDAAGEIKTDIAGQNGLGTVRSGTIERSNVDLTTELVDLIMAQRNFQANSKAIETDHTMTKSVIDSVRS